MAKRPHVVAPQFDVEIESVADDVEMVVDDEAGNIDRQLLKVPSMWRTYLG